MKSRTRALWSLALWALPFAACAHVLTTLDDDSSIGWSFEPWVSTFMLLSITLYLVGFARLQRRSKLGQQRHRWEAAAYLAGWLVLAVAFVSPLDALSGALFSAHMVQHELLMIVAAPLLVLGRPLAVWVWAFPRFVRVAIGRVVRRRPIQTAWCLLTRPLTTWALHAVALWAWHAPRAFEAALLHPGVHALQHTSFLASALLFWWTIFGRRADQATRAPALLSLFTTMVHTGALGALLTLAPGLWYPLYWGPTRALGFDPLQDQQLGGLVMWVPGGLAYFVGALFLSARWLLRRNAPAADIRTVPTP